MIQVGQKPRAGVAASLALSLKLALQYWEEI